MEVEAGQGVVLAFESNYDAERYARSLRVMEGEAEDYEEASVQALDLEALVVSSHEAGFGVATVFAGDLQVTSAAELPYIMRESGVEPPPGAVTIAVTLVPEDMYEGKTSVSKTAAARDMLDRLYGATETDGGGASEDDGGKASR